MKALIVPVAGPARVEDLDPNDLDAMQRLVGGYFEVVVVPGAVMWVNEDGRRLGLPHNQLASELINGIAVMAGVRGIPILGDVVLTGPADGRGDWTDVPDALVGAIRRAEA